MPTAPGYANVSCQLVLSGLSRPAYLTFGVHPSDPDPNSVCTKVGAAYAAASSLNSRMDNAVTMSQVRASVGQDGGADLVGVRTFAHVGAISVATTSANTALLVHKVTTRGGRRGRGRMFIPWIVSETAVDEAGIIDSASLATMQAAVDAFWAALVTQGVPMFLLHDPGLTAEGPPNEVTGLSCDKLISTQRRRLGRR